MSEPKPNFEAQPLAESQARLNATNSQIGNASQVVNSPGAVVSQTHITQVEASPGLSRNDLIFWALIVLAILAVASRATINIGLPPVVGQIVAGAVLGGIAWKFFEKVEAVLTNNTRLEIAVWLVGIKTEDKVPWPETFAKVFDRVFGTKHLSWKCLWRVILISSTIYALLMLWAWMNGTLLVAPSARIARKLKISEHNPYWLLVLTPLLLTVAILADYLGLLSTRLMLRFAPLRNQASDAIIILLADAALSWAIGFVAYATNRSVISSYLQSSGSDFFSNASMFTIHTIQAQVNNTPLQALLLPSPLAKGIWMIPVQFTSIWLWLYAASGFTLKAARYFDRKYQHLTKRFDRTFDIEKKPLTIMGAVSGVIVAVVYWAGAIAWSIWVK